MEIDKDSILLKKEFVNSIVENNKPIINDVGNDFELNSYQLFVKNFINPNTPYQRILANHETGTGKTITALNTGLEFIKTYKQNKLITNEDNGYVIIIGFTKHLFKNELLSKSEYGLLNKKEVMELRQLLQIPNKNTTQIALIKELKNRYGKRFKNKLTNGFYRFFGYKELFNRLLIISNKNINIEAISEATVLNHIKSGNIKINLQLLAIFKNSLIICDEIHNVWNSYNFNNWGIALQIIFDYYSRQNNIRVLLLTATPLTNSPLEIISLINLLVPIDMKVKRLEIFDSNNHLTDFGIERIGKLLNGRISYVQGRDIEFFPSKEIVGELLTGIKQLRLVKCEMSKLHFDTYKYESLEESKISNLKDEDKDSEEFKLSESIKAEMKTFPINLSLHNRYLMDYVLPNPESNYGLFKSNNIKQALLNASDSWLNKNRIEINQETGLVYGNFLLHDNIKNYSTKYYQLFDYIKNIVKNKEGKILIFHQYVTNSGVLLLAEFLKTNGILSDQDNEPVSNTLCSICFEKLNKHTDQHKFKPLRFAIAYGDISKKQIDESISNFNLESNKDGETLKILIGSRFIKEGFDLKAIRHLFIMHMPDNISTLLQIFGRAIRKNSHISLPTNQRTVKIYILVSSLPNELNDYSFEELLYKKKLEIHEQIQIIENIIHKNAIDNYINANINVFEENIMETNILQIDSKPIDITRLENYSFNAFYMDNQIEYIKMMIIKLFKYVSPYFDYSYLLYLVNNPPFKIHRNSKIIDEGMFLVAINYLIVNPAKSSFINKNNINVIIKGPYQYLDKIYYITNEVNSHDDFNNFNKIRNIKKSTYINVNQFINGNKSNLQNDEIISFLDKYDDDSNIEIIYKYDIHFQKIILENIIKYYMSQTKDKYENIYSRLLNYYKQYNLLIFNKSLPNDLKEEFKQFDKIPIGYLIGNDMYILIDNEFKHRLHIPKSKNYNNNKYVGIQTIDNNMVKFKIKKLDKKAKNTDKRAIETGIVCNFKDKEELISIAKFLNIEITSTKKKKLCDLIEKEFLQLELKNKDDTKWFYFLSDYRS